MQSPEQPQEESREASIFRHITQTARLMSEQAHLSPEAFLAKYGESTKAAFAGSLDEAIAVGATPVLICARNEEKTLGATLRGLALSKIPVQPIVIDNASTDQTGAIARSMGAEVIREETPGLPNALRAGFSFFQEKGYRGAILHTDADSVPLPTWAGTMMQFGEKTFPDGGHAYGRIVHYDGLRVAIKNGLLTIGNATKNVLADRRGHIPVHVRNGIVLTGNDDLLLKNLANLPEPTAKMSTDGAISFADTAADKPQATCRELQALVLTSGRRHETIRRAIKNILPKNNTLTYVERQDNKS